MCRAIGVQGALDLGKATMPLWHDIYSKLLKMKCQQITCSLGLSMQPRQICEHGQ